MPLSARCDGHDDCGDEADEERCDILPDNVKEHRLSRTSYSTPINLTFNLIRLEEVNEDNLSLKVWIQVSDI